MFFGCEAISGLFSFCDSKVINPSERIPICFFFSLLCLYVSVLMLCCYVVVRIYTYKNIKKKEGVAVFSLILKFQHDFDTSPHFHAP